jgi:hypothetical protein
MQLKVRLVIGNCNESVQWIGLRWPRCWSRSGSAGSTRPPAAR